MNHHRASGSLRAESVSLKPVAHVDAVDVVSSTTTPAAPVIKASVDTSDAPEDLEGESGALAGASADLGTSSDADAKKKKSRFGLPSFLSSSGRKSKKEGRTGAIISLDRTCCASWCDHWIEHVALPVCLSSL